MEAEAGNATVARSLLDQAIQVTPHMPHAYACLARLEASQGDYARARHVFSRGAEAAAGNAPLLHVGQPFTLVLAALPVSGRPPF